MPRPHIITGLDIGTNKIKMLSVAKKGDTPNFEIVGQHQEISFGVRKGVVVEVPKVAEIISTLVKIVGGEQGQKVGSAYVGIGGCHIFCTPSHGLVSVSRADQKISEEDIERVIQNSQFFPLPANKEILEVFPKEFIVDGESGIKEAVGMQGVRLEANVLALCGFSPYLKNSTQSVLSAGLQIDDFVVNPLASARAVLTPREKELGVLLLDIGAGTTSLAIFEEGSLIHAAIFPVGSENITRDIAICLKIDIDIAEKIKLEFGSCKGGAGRSERKIKIEGEEPLIFSQKSLIEIIDARAEEILDFANKELRKASRQALLPAGIVLTGGGAKLPGIKELVKKELKLPCRIGVPKGFVASLEDPAFSTVCGLVLEGVDLEESDGVSSAKSEFKNRIKKIFKMFVP